MNPAEPTDSKTVLQSAESARLRTDQVLRRAVSALAAAREARAAAERLLAQSPVPGRENDC